MKWFCGALTINLLALILFGGARFQFSWGKFEWGTLAPWAAAWMLITLSWYQTKKSKNTLDLYAQKIGQWVETHSKKIILYGFAILTLQTFVAHSFRHLNFSTDWLDHTYLLQALYQLFEGPYGLRHTLGIGSYLADHFSPSLFLMAPFAAFKNDFLIFAVQSLGFAIITAFLVTSTFQDSPKKKVLIFFLVICHPALRNAMIWDFREDFFIYIASCLIAIGWIRSHIALILSGLVLGLLSKEHVGAIYLFLPFLFLFEPTAQFSKRTRILLSTFTFIVSAGTFLAIQKWIYPILRADVLTPFQDNMTSRFGSFGNSPSEIVMNLITQPARWITLIKLGFIENKGLPYLFQIFGPIAFLCFKKWPWVLISAPMILINVFASAPSHRSLGFHYDLIFLPFLFMGTGLAIQSIKTFNTRKIILVLGIALFFSGRWPGYRIWQEFPSSSKISDARFLNKIPCNKNLLISGNGRTLAHLARCSELAGITFKRSQFQIIQNPHGEPFNPKGQLVLNLEFPAESQFYNENIRNSTSCSESNRFCILDLGEDPS